MDIAIWVLVALVAWIGFSITSELKEIAKEAKAIRLFLQTDSELKHSSIPANLLNYVAQIGEAVIGKVKEDQKKAAQDHERQVLGEINSLMTPSRDAK